jgi:hypothetical protein
MCECQINNVQILTPEERQRFNGITIEQPGKRGYDENVRKAQIRIFSFGLNSVLQIIIGVIVAGITLALLSSSVFIFIVGAVVWFLLRSIWR